MDIKKMMAEAKKLQTQMDKAKQELAKKEIVVEKQGVKVTVFGNKQVKAIEINEALIDPEDKDIIEGLLVIALNEALEEVDQLEAANQPQGMGGMGF